MKEIVLSRGMVALVDDDDYEMLSTHEWYAKQQGHGKSFYGARNLQPSDPRGRAIQMHREILHVPCGYEIDHIDGNGLNNQRENLRVVTHRENTQNRHGVKSSRFPGVHKLNDQPRTKPWNARIRVGTIRKSLGVFATEEEAYQAYKTECEKLECKNGA